MPIGKLQRDCAVVGSRREIVHRRLHQYLRRPVARPYDQPDPWASTSPDVKPLPAPVGSNTEMSCEPGEIIPDAAVKIMDVGFTIGARSELAGSTFSTATTSCGVLTAGTAIIEMTFTKP